MLPRRCRMMQWCHSFMLCFKCIFQLYTSGFFILRYGYGYLCVSFTYPLIECHFLMMVATITRMSVSILFIWLTHLGFLILGGSGSATTHLPGWFCPWIEHVTVGLLNVAFRLSTWTLSRLFNWLPPRCLVTWINHLPPLCWSTFWKYSLKW